MPFSPSRGWWRGVALAMLLGVAGGLACEARAATLASLIWAAHWVPAASAWIGAQRSEFSWTRELLSLPVVCLWPLAAVLLSALIASRLPAGQPADGAQLSLFAYGHLCLPLIPTALAGYGLGRFFGSRGAGPWAASGSLALVLLGVEIFALPGVLGAAPWPGWLTRTLQWLSPAGALAQARGIDWLRHPLVYVGAGTDRFPGLRSGGWLAAGAWLLVGCAGIVCARRRSLPIPDEPSRR